MHISSMSLRGPQPDPGDGADARSHLDAAIEPIVALHDGGQDVLVFADVGQPRPPVVHDARSRAAPVHTQSEGCHCDQRPNRLATHIENGSAQR